MLYELYLEGYFDYRKYLFDNFTKFNMSFFEASLLVYLLDIYKVGKRNFTVSELEEKFLVHKNDISLALQKLVDNNCYALSLDFESGFGKECFDVKPFFDKIKDLYTQSDSKLNDNEVEKICNYVENNVNHMLNNYEYDDIITLINEGHNYADFQKVIKYLKSARYDISVRNIMKFIDHNIDSKEESVNIDPILQDFFKQNGIK